MSEATQEPREKKEKSKKDAATVNPNGGADGIYDASSIKVLEGLEAGADDFLYLGALEKNLAALENWWGSTNWKETRSPSASP
jgi:hypothetical protein